MQIGRCSAGCSNGELLVAFVRVELGDRILLEVAGAGLMVRWGGVLCSFSALLVDDQNWFPSSTLVSAHPDIFGNQDKEILQKSTHNKTLMVHQHSLQCFNLVDLFSIDNLTKLIYNLTKLMYELLLIAFGNATRHVRIIA